MNQEPRTPENALTENWIVNSASYAIVDGILIFSGFVFFRGNLNAKNGRAKLFKVEWDRNVVRLNKEADFRAPCNDSMYGRLRKGTEKSSGKAHITLGLNGVLSIDYKDTNIPRIIALSSFFVVLGIVGRKEEPSKMILGASAPEVWVSHPSVVRRENVVIMTGGQGVDATSYSADGRVMCRFPEEDGKKYEPAPKQSITFEVPCGWAKQDYVTIKIDLDGAVRAYTKVKAAGRSDARGQIMYDQIVYSVNPGAYVKYAGIEENENDCDEWGSDSEPEAENESTLTYRLVGEDVFYLQGHIDLKSSLWTEGSCIARLPIAPTVRQIYCISCTRIDIENDGRIFLPESFVEKSRGTTKRIDFNFFLIAPKKINLQDGTDDVDKEAKVEALPSFTIVSSGSKKFRERGNADHCASLAPQDQAKYRDIKNFFLQHDATGSEITHPCLGGTYKNPFSNTGKWFFPDNEEAQTQLRANIAWLYTKGIPTYMCERQTDIFPFIEDLDIQCYPDWDELGGIIAEDGQGGYSMPADQFIMKHPHLDSSPGYFMEERANALIQIYPQFKSLEVIVFSASGFNKSKNLMKTSYHLVWPGIMTDRYAATEVREETLKYFIKNSKGPNGANPEGGSYRTKVRLQMIHPSNTWDLVFDKSVSNSTNGLRMPFNDKAKLTKVKIFDGNKSTMRITGIVTEHRPQLPVGIIRFSFGPDEAREKKVIKARWIADKDTYSITEWIRLSSCRTPRGTEVTKQHIIDRSQEKTRPGDERAISSHRRRSC